MPAACHRHEICHSLKIPITVPSSMFLLSLISRISFQLHKLAYRCIVSRFCRSIPGLNAYAASSHRCVKMAITRKFFSSQFGVVVAFVSVSRKASRTCCCRNLRYCIMHTFGKCKLFRFYVLSWADRSGVTSRYLLLNVIVLCT